MWICVSTRAAPNVLTLGTLRFLTWIGSSFDLASGYFDPILQHFFALWLISNNKYKQNTICPMRQLFGTGSPFTVMQIRTDLVIPASVKHMWSGWKHKSKPDFKLALHFLGLRSNAKWGWPQLSLQIPSGISGSITAGTENDVWSLFIKVSPCDLYFFRSALQCQWFLVMFPTYEFILV